MAAAVADSELDGPRRQGPSAPLPASSQPAGRARRIYLVQRPPHPRPSALAHPILLAFAVAYSTPVSTGSSLATAERVQLASAAARPISARGPSLSRAALPLRCCLFALGANQLATLSRTRSRSRRGGPRRRPGPAPRHRSRCRSGRATAQGPAGGGLRSPANPRRTWTTWTTRTAARLSRCLAGRAAIART